jgi:hypothetical protein
MVRELGTGEAAVRWQPHHFVRSPPARQVLLPRRRARVCYIPEPM